MEIEYKENYIYIKNENDEVGYIQYTKVNDHVIDVTTTYVNEKYRGQGIAGKLFEQLVLYSRNHNYKIIPSCSYIKNKLEKSTKYADIYYNS